ncbi:MAG: succinyl-diaminopimelate desuccinylase [Rhodobacteraceae bacterium]|nr:succinyl-diaminopimelate desuccinylase [Paracoccaceae bacterium]
MNAPDPVALTADLVRCPSVTPEEGGALQLLQRHLLDAGFVCTRVDREGTPNLFARWGARGHRSSFGFNGHTDVVPPGDAAAWSDNPFSGVIRDGRLWGRGAADMKSAVAAFVSAAIAIVREEPPDGAILIAITGDEEGPARDGTRALLDWMEANGEAMQVCLVGEPTCPERLGEMIKIGRRGSMNVVLTASGLQGHVAYPHRAANPLPVLVAALHRLAGTALDDGTAHFDASTLALTSIDTGNTAGNVIPGRAMARFNIRFNDAHSPDSLRAMIEDACAEASAGTDVVLTTEVSVSGEAFLTPPGAFTSLVARAVETETGIAPVFSTSGGTSDARFIRAHCPVVEFGLVGRTMHQIDEHVAVDDITRLRDIYRRILSDWFRESASSGAHRAG